MISIYDDKQEITKQLF